MMRRLFVPQIPYAISISGRVYRECVELSRWYVIKWCFNFWQEDGYRGIVTRLRYRVTITSKSKGPFFFIELNNEIKNV